MLRLRAASRSNLAERERNARVSGASGGRIGGTERKFRELRSRDALASKRGDARNVYQRWLISSRVGEGDIQVKRQFLYEFCLFESQSRVFNHNKSKRSHLQTDFQQISHKMISISAGKSGSTFLHCTFLILLRLHPVGRRFFVPALAETSSRNFVKTLTRGFSMRTTTLSDRYMQNPGRE